LPHSFSGGVRAFAWIERIYALFEHCDHFALAAGSAATRLHRDESNREDQQQDGAEERRRASNLDFGHILLVCLLSFIGNSLLALCVEVSDPLVEQGQLPGR
jgi:hypothetical protein